MKRIYVYIGMLLISLTTTAMFAFTYINQANAIPLGLNSIVNPTGAPGFTQQFYGDFSMNLDKPMDVTKTDSFVYVSDTNNKRVVVFDLAGSPLFSFGEAGNLPGQFNFPYGISTDSQGRVYVADLYNGTISIHDEKGVFLDYFAYQYSQNKVISSPGGLRIIDEKVYVTDIQGNKVLVFNLEGELLLEIGEAGKGEGKFIAPNAITADNEGNIYVVDTGNSRVQVFDSEGSFIRIINGSSDGTGTSVFVNPRGIGIDGRGIIHVVSNLTHMVYGFTKEGEQTFVLGSMGEGNGQFGLPNGLFIDDTDQVYITDTLNLRVSVFK